MNLFLAAVTCKNVADKSALIEGGSLPHTCATAENVRVGFTLVFTIIGAIAFLVVVLAGTRYAFSKGEPDNVQKAKNEFKYAVIGLIIAFLAVAIVNFAIGKFFS